jgi:hypothetical protein
MTSGLEDKIIAYFDGELSDADGAELLHRVSVSPEIRNLFREHEMLREMAHESASAVTISPEIESSLFAKIEALAEKPARKKAVWVFSRRTALVAALALVLISGSLGYLVPRMLSGNNSQQVAQTSKNIDMSALPSTQPVAAENNIAQQTISSNRSHESNKAYKSFTTSATSDETPNQNIAINQPSVSNKAASLVEIQQVSPRFQDIHSGIGGERLSPFDQKGMPEEPRSLFEASLQTSSGFTYPADASPVKPFADQRLSLAYHITENNLIGLRIGSGLYQELGNVTQSFSGGVEVLSRNLETKRSFSEEVFLAHLFPIDFVAPFFLEFAVDGGFVPNGYSVGAEAGVRIPFSENMMFDASFSLSRVHSNALTSDQILASENATTPILLESVDIHNTLYGRLHYGLLYRF